MEFKSHNSLKKRKRATPNMSLSHAFDHCPTVLLSFLEDREASYAARAVCIPRLLVKARYVVKRHLSLTAFLKLSIPSACVVAKLSVAMDEDCYTQGLLARIPDTIKSMDISVTYAPQGPQKLLLDAKSLPRSLTRLTLTTTRECPLLITNTSAFPLTLQELYLSGSSFNQPIQASDLPALRILTLGRGFTVPLDNLPDLLTELTLDGDTQYSHQLDRLPDSVTRLELRRQYNLPLDRLPSSLSYLLVSTSSLEFNRPLDCLPDSLTELDLDSALAFNHPLDHLPRQLRVLKLGRDFDQPLDSLPPNLTHLQFNPSCPFNQPLDHLPQSLETLILPEQYDHPLDRLPLSLHTLNMSIPFNHPLSHLPPSLTTLIFPSSSLFNHPIDRFPTSISRLQLGHAFNQPVKQLPCHLTYLSIGNAFDHDLPLKPHLVPVLEVLRLGTAFNQLFAPPPSLTELTLAPDGCFDQPLDLRHHSNLQKLHVTLPYWKEREW